MKILLIKPKWFITGGIYRFLDKVKFTPLNLSIIASLSDGHSIKIIDGDWQEIPYDEDCDLVGITVTTFTSQSAYDIAKKFRTRGIKVVMGGVHPSLLPNECLEHTDSVVIGEAEYVWKDVLKDAENKKLKKIYKSDKVVDMNDVPFPKRELCDEQPWFACIQATRGCVNSCRYCYLPNVPWFKHRKRDINLVYEELKSMKQRIIFFVDDNLFADREYALKLFEKITPLKKIWSIQAPTTIAKDEKMLESMERAGCFNVQMGFQTFNPESLEWASIKQNKVEEYTGIVQKLHKYNMLATGFFIFGFDKDDKSIFNKSVQMIKEINLDDAHLYIFTPYPGTDLFNQMQNEGRLLSGKGRSNYGWANAVFTPKLMSPEELEHGVQSAYGELYKYFKRKLPKSIISRLPWLIKHPYLLYVLVHGGLGKADIKKSYL